MTHDHDHGLKHDLPRLLGRRAILAGIAVLAAGAANAQALSCVANPAETAGPFPGDGTNGGLFRKINALTDAGVVREDLRPSFGTLSGAAEGLDLTLELTLVDAAAGCQPLAGRAVYFWHCDTAGDYSLYNVKDQNWLRGVGVSDADGVVRFTAIFPGAYPGRWPHMHFEVFDSLDQAVSGRKARLISQLAMPAGTCTAAYAAHPAYAEARQTFAGTSISQDGVFRDNTPAELAQQTLALTGDPAAAMAGTVLIAL